MTVWTHFAIAIAIAIAAERSVTTFVCSPLGGVPADATDGTSTAAPPDEHGPNGGSPRCGIGAGYGALVVIMTGLIMTGLRRLRMIRTEGIRASSDTILSPSRPSLRTGPTVASTPVIRPVYHNPGVEPE